MSLSFKRSSLVTQVADAIRTEIRGKAWPEWIPSERELSNSLHVSRNTCRFALNVLYREGLLEPIQGRGVRVKRATQRQKPEAGAQTHSVGIILPDVIGRLRPSNAIMIEELQAELYDMQVRLQLHNSPAYYGGSPEHALEKLVEKYHHDCWILMLSHRPLQSWFMERNLPCVISGSTYADIDLPSVDIDYRAVCRHAVGRLLSLGHRRVVFLNRQSRAAGDLESEEGFREGIKSSAFADIDARVVYHDDQLDGVSLLGRQLFKAAAKPPTGLIIANPYCYLSMMGSLARWGLRIPTDVSAISRDDDSFLSYMDPVPARYHYDTAQLVKKMMFLIRAVLNGSETKRNAVRIVPHFIPGGSLQKL